MLIFRFCILNLAFLLAITFSLPSNAYCPDTTPHANFDSGCQGDGPVYWCTDSPIPVVQENDPRFNVKQEPDVNDCSDYVFGTRVTFGNDYLDELEDDSTYLDDGQWYWITKQIKYDSNEQQYVETIGIPVSDPDSNNPNGSTACRDEASCQTLASQDCPSETYFDNWDYSSPYNYSWSCTEYSSGGDPVPTPDPAPDPDPSPDPDTGNGGGNGGSGGGGGGGNNSGGGSNNGSGGSGSGGSDPDTDNDNDNGSGGSVGGGGSSGGGSSDSSPNPDPNPILDCSLSDNFFLPECMGNLEPISTPTLPDGSPKPDGCAGAPSTIRLIATTTTGLLRIPSSISGLSCAYKQKFNERVDPNSSCRRQTYELDGTSDVWGGSTTTGVWGKDCHEFNNGCEFTPSIPSWSPECNSDPVPDPDPPSNNPNPNPDPSPNPQPDLDPDPDSPEIDSDGIIEAIQANATQNYNIINELNSNLAQLSEAEQQVSADGANAIVDAIRDNATDLKPSSCVGGGFCIPTGEDFSVSGARLIDGIKQSASIGPYLKVPSLGTSVCPVWHIPIYDDTVVMDIHCSVLADNRGLLSPIFIAVWSLAAAVVFLRA